MKQYYAVPAVIIIVIIVAAALFFASEPTSNIAINEIKIGVIAPLTGDAAVYGTYAKDGIEMAFDEINGHVNGRQIKLIYEDDQTNPKLSATASEKLASMDNADAVIYFTGSGATFAGAPILENSRMPTVIGLASNPNLRDAGDYIFRIIAVDSLQGKQWVKLVMEFNYTKPAILFVNNAWGAGLKDAFVENYKDVVLVETMEESAKDVKSQLIKIKEYKPDVLLMPCYIKDCITAVKQMDELDIDLPVISGDVFHNQEVLDATGDATEGYLVTTFAEGRGREWDEFREKFEVIYNKEPNSINALAYDSMYTLYYAMQKAGTDKEQLKNELYNTNFVGPSGLNKFDSYGEVEKEFVVHIVKGRKFIEFE